jgi:ligand-binding SRPBCC domain-containing protein
VKLYFKTPVQKSLETVKKHFDRELFEYLAPPLIPAKLERFDGSRAGDEVHLKMGGFQRWVSLITEDKETPETWFFVDEGKILPWPLKYWKHIHRVDRDQDQKSCFIIDDIEFKTASPLLDKMIYPFLWKIFSLRPERYQKFFSRE